LNLKDKTDKPKTQTTTITRPANDIKQRRPMILRDSQIGHPGRNASKNGEAPVDRTEPPPFNTLPLRSKQNIIKKPRRKKQYLIGDCFSIKTDIQTSSHRRD
jgi:hypothetical protein